MNRGHVAIVLIVCMLTVVSVAAQQIKRKTQVETVRKVQVDDEILKIASASKPSIKFSPQQTQLMSQVVSALGQNNTEAAKNSWSALVNNMVATKTYDPATTDIQQLVQWALRQSYLEQMEDLRFHAEKVKYFNEQKKNVREYIDQLRSFSWLRPGQMVTVKQPVLQEFEFKRYQSAEELNLEYQPDLGMPSENPTVEVNADELDEMIKKYEEELNTLGEDAQLANIDLQSALQRQQQTLQLMSNVSKMMHDVATAIIRKIG